MKWSIVSSAHEFRWSNFIPQAYIVIIIVCEGWGGGGSTHSIPQISKEGDDDGSTKHLYKLSNKKKDNAAYQNLFTVEDSFGLSAMA